MNTNDIIEKVIRHEIAKGQAAWEMVQDGYGGDIEGYIADYRGDYEVTHGEVFTAGEKVTEYYHVRNVAGDLYHVDDAGNVTTMIF